MSFSIEYFDKGDYVIVKAVGDWTQETSRQILDTARVSAIACGVRRILLDLRELSQPVHELTRFSFGRYAADTIHSRFRLAGIGSAENVTHFAETVARNRGGVMRAFTDEESAMQWLML